MQPTPDCEREGTGHTQREILLHSRDRSPHRIGKDAVGRTAIISMATQSILQSSDVGGIGLEGGVGREIVAEAQRCARREVGRARRWALMKQTIFIAWRERIDVGIKEEGVLGSRRAWQETNQNQKKDEQALHREQFI